MDYIARFWEKIDDSHVKCFLCPRNCVLKEGQRGACFVRKNIDNKLVLTTYNRSSGFCVDPIEKKPLNHFYPGSSVFSFGTAGCNLMCKFCQNSDISRTKKADRLNDTATPDTIAQTAKKLGCKSVAYTYNEPLIFLEYAVDTAIECKKWGIKNVAVSAGYVNKEARKEFFSHMDAANIDLKAFSNDFYKKMCSCEISPVLETLKYVKNQTDVWLEITNLIIPDENDSDEELEDMCSWIVDNLGDETPIHFSAFHPAYKVTNKQRTPFQTLQKALEIAKNKGMKYVYTGNVNDKKNASTYCHNCNQLLIERNYYEIGKTNITKEGKCKNCGQICAGFFDDDIKNWGSNFMPYKFV